MNDDSEPFLHHDCISHLFTVVPLEQLIKLRLVCRSWNETICQQLRAKDCLKVIDYNERFTPRQKTISYLNDLFFEQRQHRAPFLRFNERDGNVYFVDYMGTNPLRIAAFLRFVANRMPNITKFLFALRCTQTIGSTLETLLNAWIPNMETFFITLTDNKYDTLPNDKIMRTINRSFQKHPRRLKELFFYLPPIPGSWLQEQSRGFALSRDFANDVFDGLTTLHLKSVDLIYQIEEPISSIKELWVQSHSYCFPSLKVLPNLERLKVNQEISSFDTSKVPELKFLKLAGRFVLGPSNLEKLNTLTKLEQFGCLSIFIHSDFRSSTPYSEYINKTVTHLQIAEPLQGYDISNFLKDLPTIFKCFSSLKQLTIYRSLDEEQKTRIKDCFPAEITVKFATFR